ncbi:alpha/beta fold hydrolase [Micromonospora sp. NPDC049204]|uniref:thioesterase II family protein n=1 Tax=Micromonospora TaxID=1873 RepID=UPI0033FCEFD2
MGLDTNRKQRRPALTPQREEISVQIPERRAGQWIRRLNGDRDRPSRLVCLPHAGGSASFFLPLASTLSSDVEVLGVQYPGRQDRRLEPMIDSIADLADKVTEALDGWTDRPTTLLGHSMGATIAFEVARRLEQRLDNSVVGLIASGRRAPSIQRGEDNVHLRDDDGLIAEIRTLNGTHGTLLEDEELLRMILPVVRNDYKAIETYLFRPGPRLRTPIAVLLGDADPIVTIEEAQAWREQTEAGFGLQTFPGGHFYLSNDIENVGGVIAAHIAAFAAGHLTASLDRPART